MLIIAAAVLGMLVGSFLNVVVARVPEGRSVVRPGSTCVCGTPVAPRDNVPVVSWLLLRGRARCCGARISVRYPVVEAGTAASFAVVAAWLGASPALPAFWFLAALSVALAAIDIATYRLPFVLVAPAYPVAVVLLGVAALAGHEPRRLLGAALGGAALWAFYRLLHQVRPNDMGYGDVRLSGLLGLYLGWLGWAQVLTGAFFGFLVGAVGGLLLIAVRRGNLKSHIPYGPYMILGTWIALAWGGPALDAYRAAFGI